MGQKLLGIKAIGWDVDQTLYQTPAAIDAWIPEQLVRAVAEHLGERREEVAPRYMAKLAELTSNTETLSSFGLDGQKVFQKLFDELPLEKYLGHDTRLMEMMARLGKKYRLFIISNGTERQVRRKLVMLGLDPADFSPLVCCYDHPGWNKPAPAPFLHVLETLALSPEQVAYVGDHPEKDIAAARAVGMQGILVGNKDASECHVAATVYDVEQLFD
jgi:putative hydrolase of the HAD superfamily